MRKRKCQALGCDVVIKTAWAFCVMHWSLLEPDVQDEIAEAYMTGQAVDYKLKTKKWYQLVSKARYLIKEHDESATEE